MLSSYQIKIADCYNIPNGNVKKLVPNFLDKERYTILYENLQLYLRPSNRIEAEKKWRRKKIRNNIVQINKQCCIQQNNGKLEK